MNVSIPKSAVILVFLGGAWWLAQRGGNAPREREDGPAAAPATATTAATDAMRSQLELAVTSAVNAAECGYSDVGYDYRTPDQATRRLVALMKSASAAPGGQEPPPGTAVDFVEGLPGAPWQVTVNPAPDSSALVIEGFGPDLSQPLFTRRAPCS